MIVVVPEAVGITFPPLLCDLATKKIDKTLPVFIVNINTLSSVPLSSDMINCAGKFDAQGTSHKTDFIDKEVSIQDLTLLTDDLNTDYPVDGLTDIT